VRPIAALSLLVALAACATQPPRPPIETTRTVAATAAEAGGRIEARAAMLGLMTQSGSESSLRLSRTSAPADWADCPTRLVRGGGNSGSGADFAMPQTRMAEIDIGLTPVADGTAVSVTPRFTATYHDIFRNLPFDGTCASTGVVERALLDAAG
jgi:hypothetical protein